MTYLLQIREKLKKKYVQAPDASLAQVVNEVDVRGLSADDAILEVERYLDTAFNSEWKEFRIIHGKGTGILRQKIHAYLKKNKNITTFRLGRVGEGDTGVTIVDRH